MPAVLIYSQKNLEYIVLSNRRIFSKDKDLVRPISNADKHVLWTDLANRKHIQKEGEHFFKQHQDYLGTPPSMDDVDGKMSPGFFLYLTFLRFQGQVYQASIVRNSDINKLTKEKSEFNDNLAKLLTLQTAMEHLVKAREYVDSESAVPEGARAQRGSRGGVFYDPDELKDKDQQEEMPTGAREVDVVQAAEADDDGDDDELVEAAIGGEEFIKKMEGKNFFAVDDYLEYLDKEVTLVEKRAMINDEAIKLRVNATELVPIEPNLKIVNADGVVTQITTTDGQILAIQKIDFSPDNRNEKGELIKATGKANLFVNSEAPNDELGSKDQYIQYSYQDKDGKQKSGYSLKYATTSDAAKFAKVKKLAKKISTIKKACKEDFNNPVSGKRGKMRANTVKEAALALALVNDTARRIGGTTSGSDVWADGKEGRPKKLDKEGNPLKVKVPTYGVTTLQARHVKVKGGKVSLEFIGKSGKTNYVNIMDKMVATELAARKKAAGKKGDTPVITTSAATVNNYFKLVAGQEFSAKNFRTYQGTATATKALEGITEIPSHFGDYAMIRYKTKDKVPIEVASTWGAEFDKYMNTQINNGGIGDEDSYKRLGLLWLLKSQYESKRDFVGRPVSENLSNEPVVALAKYINPEVFDQAGWNDAFHLEQEEFLKSNAPEDLANRIETAQAKLAAKANK